MSNAPTRAGTLAALAEHLPSLVAAAADGERATYGYSDVLQGRAPTTSTAYGTGSTSKVFAALTAMRLVSDGLLALHEPVSAVLGDHPLLADTTCHHLLCHTSGIPPLHARFAAYATGTQPDRSGGTGATPDWARRLHGPGLDFTEAAGLLEYLSGFRIRRLAPPGRTFSYSNEGYILLAGVIARVAGTSYEEACREAVLTPLGLGATAFLGSEQAERLPDVAVPYHPGSAGPEPVEWWVAPAWAAPGGLLSSADDLLALGGALRDRAVPGIRPECVELMLAPHAERSGGGFYGYGVAGQRTAGGTVLGHGGARVGTACALYWSDTGPGAVVALSNVMGAPVDAAAKALLGGPPTTQPGPAPGLPLEAAQRDRLAGRYWTAEGGHVTVRGGDSGLEVDYAGRVLPLRALSATRFVSQEEGLAVQFLVDGTQPAWALSFGERILTRRKAISPWPLGTLRA